MISPCRIFTPKGGDPFERYMGKDTDDDLRSVYRQSAEVIPLREVQEK